MGSCACAHVYVSYKHWCQSEPRNFIGGILEGNLKGNVCISEVPDFSIKNTTEFKYLTKILFDPRVSWILWDAFLLHFTSIA